MNIPISCRLSERLLFEVFSRKMVFLERRINVNVNFLWNLSQNFFQISKLFLRPSATNFYLLQAMYNF